jgi:hypothetical protein
MHVPWLPTMLFESREVRPGPRPRQVLNEHGIIETVPGHWELLPPGDAALSRRIKQDGPSLTVIELRGRKRFSKGIWAPADRIAALRQERAMELGDPAYHKRLESGRRRRAAEEVAYAGTFREAVLGFLNFDAVYSAQAELLAGLIAAHATPVGSGTVARTVRIPVEERAAAATIAWLRHQTTGYDQMAIPRVKGRRREVRRMLSQRSSQLMGLYRAGHPIDAASCPLHAALLRAGFASAR